jgi:organic radical activating enzyme
MFGNNVRRPREKNPDSLQVQDVFYTIQGEGPFSGQPAVFIRLTGCNLSCWFCDTVWDDLNDGYSTPQKIVDFVDAASQGRTDLVVITGGEPLRQEIGLLVSMLGKQGYRVQIETAGVIYQNFLRWQSVHVVVSPKTKKVHEGFNEINHNIYWKYVIKAGETSVEDGLPLESTQKTSTGIGGGKPARPPEHVLQHAKNVYLSPMDEQDPHKNAANYAEVGKIAMRYGYRCGVQLHKLLNIA